LEIFLCLVSDPKKLPLPFSLQQDIFLRDELKKLFRQIAAGKNSTIGSSEFFFNFNSISTSKAF
jgi:hypothetical protein